MRDCGPDDASAVGKVLAAVAQEMVIDAAGKALAQVPRLPAHCTIYGYSAFPSSRSAKVLYAAVYDAMGRLGLLHSVLGQALTDAKVLSAPPKRFTPHVTMAKLERLTGCVRMLKAANAGGYHADMPISEVGLYRTVRPGNGPSHYECVSTWSVDK
jgi:2'-5' RNA ligase